MAGSSGAIASSHRRADAVPRHQWGKLTANILASWLRSDLRSSLVISAAESGQKRTWAQHDVMASARSQSIQGVGPLGVSQLCSLGVQSVAHSLHLTLCSLNPEDVPPEQCRALSHLWGEGSIVPLCSFLKIALCFVVSC